MSVSSVQIILGALALVAYLIGVQQRKRWKPVNGYGWLIMPAISGATLNPHKPGIMHWLLLLIFMINICCYLHAVQVKREYMF